MQTGRHLALQKMHATIGILHLMIPVRSTALCGALPPAPPLLPCSQLHPLKTIFAQHLSEFGESDKSSVSGESDESGDSGKSSESACCVSAFSTVFSEASGLTRLTGLNSLDPPYSLDQLQSLSSTIFTVSANTVTLYNCLLVRSAAS